jgi:ribosomal protein L11 methyltransferase
MSSAAEEWLELASLAELEAVEALSEAFGRWGQGVAIEQPVVSSGDGEEVSLQAGAPVLVKTYLPLSDPAAAERRQQIERAVWALGKLRQVGPLTVRTLREEDWANAWKEHFLVHRVGRRTVIVPTWRVEDLVAQEDEVVLLLDPGMAFGTGLHPTTRLCLSALEDAVQPGSRVLDVGTGSGILAIAAAKLGAAQVEAVEIDPVAVRVCRANVARNGVEHAVAIREGTLDLAADRDPTCDLAVANISIKVLLELHDVLASHLRPGALAVLSGVLAERAQELVDVLQAAGWQHERTEFEQDWVAVMMRAPHAR